MLWDSVHMVTAVENNVGIANVYRSYFPNDVVVIADAHQYLLDHYNEFDFIWSSFPCQSHSRARYYGYRNSDSAERKYPDLGLYQEIIFLDRFYDGLWVVENVDPYYDPLIKPTAKIGRHLFWSNFRIPRFDINEADVMRDNIKQLEDFHGFNLDGFKLGQRKDQVLRNCVYPPLGKAILDKALNIKEEINVLQLDLF